MKTLHIAAATLALGVFATGMVVAQSVTLPQGTTINATMDNAINTATAYEGQKFTMHVTQPYPSSALRGAYITGHVLSVTHARQGVKPELQLALDRLVLHDGSTVDISAQVTSMQQNKSENNTGHTALTAVGGMILGNMIGKTIFHTNIGGIAGLAGGALVGANAKVNFTVPAGAAIQAQLIHGVVIRRQAK